MEKITAKQRYAEQYTSLMQAHREHSFTDCYMLGKYGHNSSPKPDDLVYCALVENASEWLDEVLTIKESSGDRHSADGLKIEYRPSLKGWELVKSKALSVEAVGTYGELVALAKQLGNKGRAFEVMCCRYFGTKQNDRQNEEFWNAGDTVYQGKAWQIKGERGPLICERTASRWA